MPLLSSHLLYRNNADEGGAGPACASEELEAPPQSLPEETS